MLFSTFQISQLNNFFHCLKKRVQMIHGINKKQELPAPNWNCLILTIKPEVRENEAIYKTRYWNGST